MNYSMKFLLFLVFFWIGSMIVLFLSAVLRVRNLQALFTILVGSATLFTSFFLKNNIDSFREWIGKRVGPDKIEIIAQSHNKFAVFLEYFSISMFLLSIIFMIYKPIKIKGFLAPSNMVGLITILIGICLFFAVNYLIKYFPDSLKQPWFLISFKVSCVFVVIMGLIMILLLKF